MAKTVPSSVETETMLMVTTGAIPKESKSVWRDGKGQIATSLSANKAAMNSTAIVSARTSVSVGLVGVAHAAINASSIPAVCTAIVLPRGSAYAIAIGAEFFAIKVCASL